MADVISGEHSVDGLLDVLVFLRMFLPPRIRAPHNEGYLKLVLNQIVGYFIFTEDLSPIEISIVIDLFTMIWEVNQDTVRMAYHFDNLVDYFFIIAGGIGIFCNTLATLCIQLGSRVFDILG